MKNTVIQMQKYRAKKAEFIKVQGAIYAAAEKLKITPTEYINAAAENLKITPLEFINLMEVSAQLEMDKNNTLMQLRNIFQDESENGKSKG